MIDIEEARVGLKVRVIKPEDDVDSTLSDGVFSVGDVGVICLPPRGLNSDNEGTWVNFADQGNAKVEDDGIWYATYADLEKVEEK